MAEEQSRILSVQEAERYYSEHVQLDSATTGSPHKTLQEAMNKGARQSWRLVGVVKTRRARAASSWCGTRQGFSLGEPFLDRPSPWAPPSTLDSC
jgi:hypothetical protein